ncbi:MAG: hypothetical protein WCJ39_03170 [bacterium]
MGRYVGYGWKELDRNGLAIGYYFTRLFFPVNDICYGLNSDAKVLCRQANAIENFDVRSLQAMMEIVRPDGKAYNLLS